MVKRTETWEERVRWYAEREWPNHTVDGLLAYCFAVDRGAKRVRLRAIFDHAPSDQEKADMWELEGGIGVHFPDDWQVSTNFEMVSPGQAADLNGDDALYRRGDTMTPLERWKQSQLNEEA